jgi:hypothetical protein
MVRPLCDRLWEVDALREGRLSSTDVAAHERHRAICAVCRERFAEDERLSALVRELGDIEHDPLGVRRLRAQILRAAATEPPPSRGWLVIAIATTVTAIALVVGGVVMNRSHSTLATTGAPRPPASSSSSAESFTGTIVAGSDAKWSRQRAGGIERVRLEDGTLHLEVRRQGPGERFFVDLPDGEIEVHGTRFEVSVQAGATTSLRVEEGVVALRRSGAPELLLHGEETWAKPRAIEAPLPSPSGSSLAHKPRAAHQDRAAVAAEYDAAVTAYREKHYSDAARKFSAFVAAHGHAPEAEDAEFLEASALAHDGHTDAAAVIAERFLARYPSSFRAKDASVLVARAARDRGDCSRARSVLAPWSKSSTLEVTNALGNCARE